VIDVASRHEDVPLLDSWRTQESHVPCVILAKIDVTSDSPFLTDVAGPAVNPTSAFEGYGQGTIIAIGRACRSFNHCGDFFSDWEVSR